jgi:small-conductance mechanosensitive channel
MEFLRTTILGGNSLLAWTIGLGITVLVFVVLRLLVSFIRGRLVALTEQTSSHWDDIIIHALTQTKFLTLLVAAVYFGSLSLTVAPNARQIIVGVATITLLLQAGIWASSAVRTTLKRYTEDHGDDGASITTMNALGFVVRLALWAGVALLALDNLGIDITALVAGLGVGGVAVALAIQNILGDLFASLSIVLDKPFVNGDFIVVGDMLGSVEYVGLKTTRIRSLSGEQLIFSNADLLGSRIRNFGRMYERRVVFTVGVTYDTPRKKLLIVPTIIREAIEQQAETRFDRSHFSAYGNSSLNFETVFYVLVPDYNVYMDKQQAVYFRIHERFEEEGIEFAFPTQTIHVASMPRAQTVA